MPISSSCLYIILQLEDHALLMGSIGLFAVPTAVMALTRKIDWYAVQPKGTNSERVQVQA
jgi:inner membrane protein involved in colicin E2 resistance